jgi:citrate lyase beta subunit
MRRAPRNSHDRRAIQETITELVDRLTADIEDSIAARAQALVSSWSQESASADSVSRRFSTSARNGVAGHSARATLPLRGRPLVPLPRAERDFRVSYLRALLADAPNRREAARRAGVPYRTLCDMVRKLRIDA